jgi:hypothetical protein
MGCVFHLWHALLDAGKMWNAKTHQQGCVFMFSMDVEIEQTMYAEHKITSIGVCFHVQHALEGVRKALKMKTHVGMDC